jgi:hypothetical protein
LETVSIAVCLANVAVTACRSLTVTWHEPVPQHSPDQPVNSEPDAGERRCGEEQPADEHCATAP